MNDVTTVRRPLTDRGASRVSVLARSPDDHRTGSSSSAWRSPRGPWDAVAVVAVAGVAAVVTVIAIGVLSAMLQLAVRWCVPEGDRDHVDRSEVSSQPGLLGHDPLVAVRPVHRLVRSCDRLAEVLSPGRTVPLPRQERALEQPGVDTDPHEATEGVSDDPAP